jgi:2-haloacid dehalogenase
MNPLQNTAAVPPSAEAFSRIDPHSIKALTFDMQGSLLDFYSTIIDAGTRITGSRGVDVDWTELLGRWRKAYRDELDGVIAGTSPWKSTDAIYRSTLDRLLGAVAWGSAISSQDRDQLNAVWSTLNPWPDTRPGLARLRKQFKLSTLSNGSMASMVNIVRTHDLPFDCVLTAELVHSSKPDPRVYALAQKSIGVRADEILMVACHKYDLAAAKAFGFKVAFIPRPLEFGPRGQADVSGETYFDAMALNLVDLANLLVQGSAHTTACSDSARSQQEDLPDPAWGRAT